MKMVKGRRYLGDVPIMGSWTVKG